MRIFSGPSQACLSKIDKKAKDTVSMRILVRPLQVYLSDWSNTATSRPHRAISTEPMQIFQAKTEI